MNATKQLPLNLTFRAAFGREDFLVAPCNEEAVALLDQWPDWPTVSTVLYGPAGSGKTHLINMWCETSGARVVRGCELKNDSVPALVGGARAVAVDDADKCRDWEALLHLYNLAKESGLSVLLTAKQPPSRWGIDLRDLDSRLRTAQLAALKAPEEDFMAALLMKQFADRHLQVNPDVLAYLLPRLERSFTAVRDFVVAVDAESLAARRRITVPLAGQVLETLQSRDD